MDNKPVIILGAGGHAKVVADILRLSGRDILGFVTPDLRIGAEFCGEKVLGGDEIINKYFSDKIQLVNGIGSLPKKNLRWGLAESMRKHGYKFATITHPKAIVSSDVSLDDGVQIMAGAIIQAGTKIGQDSIINTGAVIDHDCNIAKNCHLAPGVVLSGGVAIGRDTHLGTGTIVTEYRSIGSNCTIAASSVIYTDVLNNTTFIQSKQQK